MRLNPVFALLGALAPLAAADITFTSPKAGASLAGGTSITVEWKDSGEAPAIADLKSYQIFLCAGGNEDATIVSTIS
jgi:hypothetical protein